METQTFITGTGPTPTLVVVFLRGGADGLSLVAPLGDDQYHKARPRLGLKAATSVALDGFFGLAPQLSDLEPMWKDGELAIIHGAGSEDQTRSHFEAQDLMEHGGLAGGGWLGRYLRARSHGPSGALSCIALGRALPESLLGAPGATVMQSLDDFSLGESAMGVREQLRALYAQEGDSLKSAAHDTFEALGRIETMRATPYRAEHGAEYADDGFGQGLRQIARLIKAGVGLEAASIDLDGWDSHFTQETLLNPLLTRLGKGLAAFRRDLGRAMDRTVVVVMTEFGRRVRENSAFGTDHGRGSVMFVAGGGVRGGRVIGPWPGLGDSSLEGPGDLPVLNNYRNVLAPVLLWHGMAPGNLGTVFPDFQVTGLDLFA